MPKTKSTSKKKTTTKKDSKKKKTSKPLKVYCGIDDPVPKNSRRGSMQECLDKKQVKYYGIKRINPSVLDTLKQDKIDKMNLKSRDDLLKVIMRHKGRLTKLSKDKKKDNITKKELEQIDTEISNIRKELKILYDKYQQINKQK
jgi:hypothetical protein